MILILFVLLIIFLLFNLYIYNKDLIAPPVVFNISFIFCCFWCLLNYSAWELNTLHLYTFLTIITGVVVYSLICYMVSFIFSNKSKELIERGSYLKHNLKKVELPNWIKIAAIILELLSIVFFVYNVLKITDGSIYTFFSSLKHYDQLVKFSSKIISIPRILSIMITLSTMLSYYFVYVIINNMLTTKKVDVLLLVSILLSILLQLSSGGRNGAVNIIISALTIALFLYKKNKKNIIKVNKTKAITFFILLTIIGLCLFPFTTKLVGRNNNKGVIEYLSIYCGAEIKNLDFYIKERENGEYKHKNENQTFIYFIEFIGKRFGFERNYKLDLPFRNINGHSLGNVYTTFYQFIYDFGYVGVIWCTALMAAISQFVYEKCKYSKIESIPNVYVLIYAYMISSILLSFFSNKFYEQNFSGTLFYGIILWQIINFYLKAKDVKNEKINKKELHI